MHRSKSSYRNHYKKPPKSKRQGWDQLETSRFDSMNQFCSYALRVPNPVLGIKSESPQIIYVLKCI